MSVSPENNINIKSGGDPCIWCCFPCLFTCKIFESMCHCFALTCCETCSKIFPHSDNDDENTTKKQNVNNIYQDKWQIQDDVIEETKVSPTLKAIF